jgi:hypothetical protein
MKILKAVCLLKLKLLIIYKLKPGWFKEGGIGRAAIAFDPLFVI